MPPRTAPFPPSRGPRPRTRRPARRVAAALALALGCGVALPGCFGTSPPSRFYALTPVPPAGERPAAEAAGTLVVGPVTLPPEIDRPQLVTRVGPHERRIHETARWVAPLQTQVARVIAENLAARLGPRRVVLAPLPVGASFERRVAVDIVTLDADEDGSLELRARWVVYDAGGDSLAAIHTEVAGTSYGNGPAEIAEAMSRALAELSDAIALAVAAAVAPDGG